MTDCNKLWKTTKQKQKCTCWHHVQSKETLVPQELSQILHSTHLRQIQAVPKQILVGFLQGKARAVFPSALCERGNKEAARICSTVRELHASMRTLIRRQFTHQLGSLRGPKATQILQQKALACCSLACNPSSRQLVCCTRTLRHLALSFRKALN